MNTIVVVAICEVMIIWIKATYIQFDICLLRVGSDGAGVDCMVCLDLQRRFYNYVIDIALVTLLSILSSFHILLLCSRC